MDAYLDTRGLLRGLDRESTPLVIASCVDWNATQAIFRSSPVLTDAVAEMLSRYVFVDAGPSENP